MIYAMKKNKAGKKLYTLTGGAANFNGVTKERLPGNVTFEQLEMREQDHRYWGRVSVFKILNSRFLQNI